MNIFFFNEDIEFQLDHSQETSQWISSVIESHNRQLSEINYIFCSDNYLLKINNEYLNHDYFTDIITFDNSETKNEVEADIFVSIDRVRENAQSQKTSFQNELNRVMIHGVLHLLGYGDKSEAEQKAMRENEDACLSLLKNSGST